MRLRMRRYLHPVAATGDHRTCSALTQLPRRLPPQVRGADMIEAVMFWNEPNNKSHWDFEIDPQWRIYAEMVKLAAEAVASENPRLLRVLGGISPIDPNFIRNMHDQGVLDRLDVVAVHGFPLDWN